MKTLLAIIVTICVFIVPLSILWLWLISSRHTDIGKHNRWVRSQELLEEVRARSQGTK